MRIAICDDETVCRNELIETINASDVLQENVNLIECINGAELLENHKKEPFDIVFLDIEMDGMSGLEAGQRLRSVDRNVIIIFLTNHQQYVFKSFRIEPFDYIVKPARNGKLLKVLNRAIKKYKEQHYIIDFKWQENSYALRTCDVVYLESDLRHVTFVTGDNRYKCVGKLDEYEKRLTPYGFLRCHKSFLVNMSYIKSIEKNEIITALGYNIDMSARRKQDCLNTFNEYILKYKV